MYIIVGLGDPTKGYDKTKHNTGFSVVDVPTDRIGVDVLEKKYRALCGREMLEGQKVILTRPQAFMNLSGENVRAMMDFYKVSPDRVIIVHGDISLEPGRLHIRTKGNAGGHNGIKNIIAHPGTRGFPRTKVGVGEKPKYIDSTDYVLSRFPKGEQESVDNVFREAASVVAMMISEGMDVATNHFSTEKTRG